MALSNSLVLSKELLSTLHRRLFFTFLSLAVTSICMRSWRLSSGEQGVNWDHCPGVQRWLIMQLWGVSATAATVLSGHGAVPCPTPTRVPRVILVLGFLPYDYPCLSAAPCPLVSRSFLFGVCCGRGRAGQQGSSWKSYKTDSTDLLYYVDYFLYKKMIDIPRFFYNIWKSDPPGWVCLYGGK